jgi:3-hydroxybutyrate dehydrogenase
MTERLPVREVLAGRCALVTGSTGGLGHAIAHGLAQAGCRIVLTGLAPANEAEAARAALEQQHGVEALYVQADLAQEDGVAALIAAAEARFGGVDVLVNNAVVRHFSPIEAFPTERWNQALAVNVSAAFHTIRLLLPGMRARGWGRIINMTSVYGARGTANRIDYVTSKAALLGMTRGVAAETAGSGVTCNAVCPGSVSTPGTEIRVAELMHRLGLSRDEAVSRFLQGKQPSGRFVAADSVVAAIVFLCGPAGDDITGAQLPVEGGWLAS